MGSSASSDRVTPLPPAEAGPERRPSAEAVQTKPGRPRLVEIIRDGVVGKDVTFEGPFGIRRAIYCDYTATGKPLSFIEDYIRDKVHPFYANTHFTSNFSAKQTSHLREEARSMIKEAVNAGDDDVVIFTGFGSNAAVDKLIHCIGLHLPDKERKTVVLVGPYEDYSTITPWKDTGAKIVRIKESKGQVDLAFLDKQIQDELSEDSGVEIIAVLSAASNISGILTDTNAVTEVVHQYGGLVCWDYATGGPYMEIDMNPSPKTIKDAVFLSPHKFVGGPGTPGILVAKRALFRDAPSECGGGGGQVSYVTRDTQLTIADVEAREEGETPAIIESVRAALCFQLKQGVGTEVIAEIDEEFCQKAFMKWKQNPNIRILGAHGVHRFSIFSLLIHHPDSGKLLHHNFVAALLNDLYGIQTRGGSACAGPYTKELLGMDDAMTKKFDWLLSAQTREDGSLIREPLEILKPGFCRVNLPFFYEDETVDYIIEAIDTVATYGWKLLPLYQYNCRNGEWNHRDYETPLPFNLHHVTYVRGKLGNIKSHVDPEVEAYIRSRVQLKAILDGALKIYLQASKLEGVFENMKFEDDEPINVSDEQKNLIWFLQPREAYLHLTMPSLKNFSRPSNNQQPFSTKTDASRTRWRQAAESSVPKQDAGSRGGTPKDVER